MQSPYIVFNEISFIKICRKLAKSDADLASIIKKYGLPPMWTRPNTFQTLILTIFEQQVSLAAAYAAFKKLKQKVGYVTPVKILQLTDEEMRNCYLTRQKMGYARGLATAVIKKEIQLNKTEEKSPLVNSKPAAIVVVKQPIAKPKPANPPVAAAKPKPAIIAEVKQPAAPPAHKPIAKHNTTGPKVDLSKRKIETIDELVIESDSLQISLYDNGEVDGDTVSIILNGQAIVSRQGLSASAFRKTIYITPELGDSIQLVMYAENLGSLPPNSGLLIVDYDNRRKEIRFSGDLSKNAAITLKRKKK